MFYNNIIILPDFSFYISHAHVFDIGQHELGFLLYTFYTLPDHSSKCLQKFITGIFNKMIDETTIILYQEAQEVI